MMMAEVKGASFDFLEAKSLADGIVTAAAIQSRRWFFLGFDAQGQQGAERPPKFQNQCSTIPVGHFDGTRKSSGGV